MILSMTCWGFSWTSGKILSNYGDPLTISFLRFALTFVSLIFILLLMKEKLSISKNGFRDLAIASVLISLYTYLFFKGVSIGKAGAGGVLVTVLNPILTYAITLILARRKPTRNEFFGLALGLVAGVVLLKLTTQAEEIFRAGNIYYLFAAVSWSVLSKFTAKAARYGSSLAFSFWMYGLGTCIMFPFSGIDSTMTTLGTVTLRFGATCFSALPLLHPLQRRFISWPHRKLAQVKRAALSSWFLFPPRWVPGFF